MKTTTSIITLSLVTFGLIPSASAITWGELDNSVNTNVGAIVIIHDNYPDTPEPRIMCSGTLIGERLFLSAGHCTDPVEKVIADGRYVLSDFRISFKDDAFDPTGWLEIEALATHPGFRNPPDSAGAGPMIDVGVLVLKQPVTTIQPAVIASEGFLNELKASGQLRDKGDGAPFTSVGYGTTLEWPKPVIIAPDGLRRRADSSYRSLFGNWLFMSQNLATGDGGTGYGDSGGPTFWVDPLTGQKILVSITSRGDIPCVSLNSAFRIDSAESLTFIHAASEALEAR